MLDNDSLNSVISYKPNPRAKKLRLKISSKGEIIVSYPSFTPKILITKFVNQHLDWIVTEKAKIDSARTNLTVNQQTIYYLGKPMMLKIQVSSLKKNKVELTENEIILTVKSEDHEEVRNEIEKFLRQKAKLYFTDRIVLLCDVINRDVSKIRITDTKTRWGSCSSNNTISLNWRLIMTPKQVSDYVIYHELAHLTHLNHSKDFYTLLKSYFPEYRKAEIWLKQNHQLLHF